MSHPVLNSGLSYFHLSVFEALRDLRNNIPEELRSAISFPPPVISRPILNKFGWLISLINGLTEFNTGKLQLLHDLLISYGYLPKDCSYEEFEIHFIIENKIPDEKLIWTGKNYVLPKLFDKLKRKDIISFAGNLCEVLCTHFKDSDGKKLNKTSLENQLGREGSPEEEKKIKNIIIFLTC